MKPIRTIENILASPKDLIAEDEKIALDWAQLQCLIDGINWQKTQKNKRFSGRVAVK